MARTFCKFGKNLKLEVDHLRQKISFLEDKVNEMGVRITEVEEHLEQTRLKAK